MSKKRSLCLGVLGLLLAGIACQTAPYAATAASPISTPSPSATAPTPAALPTETPPVFEDLFILSTHEITEEGANPDYTIQIKEPLVEGSRDERAAHFNAEVDYLIRDLIDGFKRDLQSIPTPPPDQSWGRSSLTVDYTVTHGDNGLISILFNISIYSAGAAHPFPFSMVLNYDLRRDRVLALADLFKPGADYLGAISRYCIQALKQEERLEFEEGAAPELINFKSWNIRPDGLLITFDPYQVMAYAAGYQQVLIPFSALSELILADGPLAPLL